jgi:ATP-binding cassette subfamily B protein
MVAKHYGRTLSAQELREAAEIGKNGVNMLGIAQAAERVGFKTLGVKLNLEKLKKEVPLPSIVHWVQNHFIVVYKISKSQVFVADPAKGLIKYTFQEFESLCATPIQEGELTGVSLLLESTAAFYENDTFKEKSSSAFLGINNNNLRHPLPNLESYLSIPQYQCFADE